MYCKNYALITAAHNEEKNIERTIDSVLNQSILPVIWLIVSDRSIDNTDYIIQSFASKHHFIKYIKISGAPVHSFGGKVNALNEGLNYIRNSSAINYDYIGILDADVSFERNYFEEVMKRFNKEEKLGLAGGDIIQFHNGKFYGRLKSLNSVAGAVQFFRRKCFESTVGFIPREYGGEDSLLEINARMNGWNVRTFKDLEVIHYGAVGEASGLKIKSRFRRGFSFYTLGYHPLFHFIRCTFRIVEKPYVIGSLSEIYGYMYAAVRYRKIDSPAEIVEFLRREQKDRLLGLFKFKVGI